MDTIYALASASGKAGVAVLRLSGPLAFEAVGALCGELPEVRKAGLRRLFWEGVELDQALVLLFEAGASFTGERVVELHLHGSVAVVNAVLRALSVQDGLRLARPGEFTRRALENGNLDLAQVEGLADLIDSETEAQRRQALRVLSGAIGRKVDGWRQRLIRAGALLEATIDFVDEDVPVDVGPEVRSLLGGLLDELRHELTGASVAERIRDGFEVAILGAPNVGKSTLLNSLAGREAAITSDVAGTTRDIIEVRMDLGGLAVTLLDTAGLRETTDRVEEIGIARAIARAEAADIRVFLREKDATLDPFGVKLMPDDLVVVSKIDLGTAEGLAISAKTGMGIDQLIAEITARLVKRASGAGTIVRERQRMALVAAIESMNLALEELETAGRGEVAAERLRSATWALDALVGRVGVEDLLGEIFASFCIGK